MPRKTSSRMELRRQAEALEARGDAPEKPKATKKAAAPRARRVKEKAVARKRLIWVVYNGSMKEEARFSYDQKEAAEEKLEQLRQKSKKLYFLQPVKEILGEGGPMTAVTPDAKDAEFEDIPAPLRALAEDDFDDEEDEEEEEEDDSEDE